MYYYNEFEKANEYIKNCVNHELSLYGREDLAKDRLGHFHAKLGANPKFVISQGIPLNIDTEGIPEAIDDEQIIGNYKSCVTNVPPPLEWADVMVVSLKYWLGVTRCMLRYAGSPERGIHPLFIDRLWIVEPVYGPFSANGKEKVGSYLVKAIWPISIDAYVYYIRNQSNVAPSLVAVKAALDSYVKNQQASAMNPNLQELQSWYDEQIEAKSTVSHTKPVAATFFEV